MSFGASSQQYVVHVCERSMLLYLASSLFETQLHSQKSSSDSAMDRKAHTLYPLSIGDIHTVHFDFTNLSAYRFKENQLEGICGFSSEPFSKRYIKVCI